MTEYDDAITRIGYLEENLARLQDRVNTLDRNALAAKAEQHPKCNQATGHRRLSVDRDDPGYANPSRVKARVMLDGVEQKSVITADEEEGVVVRHVLDARGVPITAGGSFALETVYGKVEILLGESSD